MGGLVRGGALCRLRGMEPIKTLSKRHLCTANEFLSVEVHEVQFPGGPRIDDWPWVIVPDYVNVVVRTMDGRYPVFRQRKYAVDGITLAPVGGHIDEGEEPLVAAKRELLEETGLVAPVWRHLMTGRVDANRGLCMAHFYLALDAEPGGEPTADDLEEQALLHLTREELSAALDAGEFKTVSWSAVVAMALRVRDAGS